MPKPRILGADGAGVVAALGEGVDGFADGDRVVLNPGLDDGARIIGEHMDGTHAELIAIPAEYVHPWPMASRSRRPQPFRSSSRRPIGCS